MFPGNSIAAPGISVILSVYNGGQYLVESVESVLQQSYKNFEFIIVDDDSTDQSHSYLQSLKDSRVKLLRNDVNKGLFANLNELIAQCNAPIIKLWSQDDIMNETCLEEMVTFHQKHPEVGLCYCDRELIDEHGELLAYDKADDTPALLSPQLHARIAFYCGSIAGNIANTSISSKALKETGGFNEAMTISADFDMWVRLAKNFYTGHVKKKLIRLRHHSGQLSRKPQHFIRRPIEDMQVFKYLLDYVDTEVKREGLQNLKKYKFVYYYTLMAKALLRGDIRTGIAFYKELKKISNFFGLSLNFLRYKLFPPAQPGFMNWKEEPKAEI